MSYWNSPMNVAPEVCLVAPDGLNRLYFCGFGISFTDIKIIVAFVSYSAYFEFSNEQQRRFFLILRSIAGRKVAITKDKNNKDCDTNGAKKSLETSTPTSKLFEKSGNGNNKNPPINPTINQ